MKCSSSVFASLLLCLAACGDTPSSAGACVSDDECKGDRICEDGECVDPDGTGSSGGEGGTGATGAGGGDISTPGGPEFLSFGANVTTLDKESWEDVPTVKLTAVLTDPDGVDDVIGGNLLSQSGTPYGAFATSGQEGAYEMTLDWDQINDVEPIDFEGQTGGSRTFRAQFFDVAGHVAEKTVTIALACDGLSACGGECDRVRCEGECISLGSDENCTACGDDCGSGSCQDSGYTCSWEHPNCVCVGEDSVEDTNALCTDGVDNDGDGYLDCIDYDCSLNPSVTVCD